MGADALTSKSWVSNRTNPILAMALHGTTATPCVSSAQQQFLGWRRDGSSTTSSLLFSRQDETPHRQSRAVEIQFLGITGLFRFCRSSPILSRTRTEANQGVGNGLSRFGHSSPILARIRAVGNQIVGNGHTDLIPASFYDLGVGVDRRAIAGRYRGEGRGLNVAAVAAADVTFSQREKGRKEKKEKDVVKLPVSVDYISSPANAYVKHLVRLRQNPKTRSATESVLVVGTIPLKEICESVVMVERDVTPLLVDVLLVREDVESPEELVKVARRIVRVSSDAMSKLSGLDSPPEVAGVLPFPATFVALEACLDDSAPAHVKVRKWCGSPRRVLVLDSIQDPGNLGTLLRTAAAFAWDGVFLLHGCCDPFNDKALRASRGASFRLPIGVGEWEHVREFAIANELKLFAGDPETLEKESSANTSLLCRSDVEDKFKVSVDDGQGLCLVLGSEGQGLSQHVTRDCVSIGIPMPGNFESLNVAVAGGILMFLLR